MPRNDTSAFHSFFPFFLLSLNKHDILMPMLQAIIFDFDGIIVDSEPLHFKATQHSLAQFGVTWDYGMHRQECIGCPDVDNFRRLNQRFQLGLDEDQLHHLVNSKTEEYRQLLKHQAYAYPGVIPLIKAAAQSYPLAICSGSYKAELDELLSRLDEEDLRRYFQHIISIEDVAMGKPDPAGYRLAAQRLNVHPEFCLAIEDSPAGVIAAKTAGMSVLAVCSTHPAEKLSLADRCVESLADISLIDLTQTAWHQ